MPSISMDKTLSVMKNAAWKLGSTLPSVGLHSLLGVASKTRCEVVTLQDECKIGVRGGWSSWWRGCPVLRPFRILPLLDGKARSVRPTTTRGAAKRPGSWRTPQNSRHKITPSVAKTEGVTILQVNGEIISGGE